MPIVYIHRDISRPELVAIYQFAHIAWVSPLRDGMNLVAKEYVACKPDGNGVLVLSSFAGAAAEMGEALLINPLDEERTALTVRRALLSPELRNGILSGNGSQPPLHFLADEPRDVFGGRIQFVKGL